MIIVFFGPVFALKTESALIFIKLARLSDQFRNGTKRAPGRVQIFKWTKDDRDPTGWIRSHGGQRRRAVMVATPGMILERLLPSTRIVFVDEAQFFGAEIISVARDLSDRGITGVYTLLPTDWQGHLFGTEGLIAIAHRAIQRFAICAKCGDPHATCSQRLTAETQQIKPGGPKDYRPLCLGCFNPYEYAPKPG